MKNKHLTDLTTGPLSKQLVLFGLPLLFSTMLQRFYNIADRAVAGMYGGNIALSAVGGTSATATTLLLCLVTGLAAGANVVISNFIGARKEIEKQEAMHTAILLAILSGVVMGIAGIFLTRPILLLMNSPSDVIDSATLYLRIIFAGTPFLLVYNFGSAILRSHGDTKHPTMILTFSGVVNVLLNLFFSAVCHIPVAGVALATIASQAISAAWVLWILFDPNGAFHMDLRQLRFHRQHLATIVRIGIPCGFNTIVIEVANATLHSSVNTFGSTVMAGNVAADSVSAMVSTIPSTLYTSCVTFSGQCFGAKKYERLTKLLRTAILLGGGIALICALTITVIPRPLLRIFAENEAAVKVGIPKLIIASYSTVLYACAQALMGVLRGMRHSTIPTALNAIFVCIPRILWVLFVFPLHPTTGMLYLCLPLANLMVVIAMTIYYLYCKKKLTASLAQGGSL